ncbi:hypothetical protein B6F84_00115 [Acidianus manzaensis]|uniref:Uncharacterized protein n=1 Tax=Acidianus manzaensis TaxID=282676 RepID=A0A1W6JWF0_9CREN|nr:hypothetical protein B6F84_00115 [Acidianus manzaensis]
MIAVRKITIVCKECLENNGLMGKLILHHLPVYEEYLEKQFFLFLDCLRNDLIVSKYRKKFFNLLRKLYGITFTIQLMLTQIFDL